MTFQHFLTGRSLQKNRASRAGQAQESPGRAAAARTGRPRKKRARRIRTKGEASLRAGASSSSRDGEEAGQTERNRNGNQI